jgi:type IV fimbrial biogenesis protein FimT
MDAAVREPQRGVTLVEMLVTMSIAVLLLTLGVSGVTALVKRNARATAVNTMVGHLNFARAQAVMRATNVRVCPVDAEAPSAGCAADADGTAWGEGYAVVEMDNAGATVAVLRLQEAPRTIEIDSGGRRFFEFEDDGTISMGGGSGNGSITFCDTAADGIAGARIRISLMGRVSLDDGDVDCES